MPTISEWLKWGKIHLSQQTSPELEAAILLAHTLKVTQTFLHTWPERMVSDLQALQYQTYCERRHSGEPVAYILGVWSFWSFNLCVTPATLIPRPETEHLVEWVLTHFSDKTSLNILELGTGSGAIALALATEKSAWNIVATDISPAALHIAQQNGQDLHLSNIEWRLGSWFTPCAATERFDVIISNPPYIARDDPHVKQGDLRFEPLTALVAEHNGLADLLHVMINAQFFLANQGWLVLEHGYQQAESVTATMQQHGYKEIITHKDFAANPRFTVGRVV